MAAEQATVPDAVMRKFAELGYEIETAARDYTIAGADRYSVVGSGYPASGRGHGHPC